MHNDIFSYISPFDRSKRLIFLWTFFPTLTTINTISLSTISAFPRKTILSSRSHPRTHLTKAVAFFPALSLSTTAQKNAHVHTKPKGSESNPFNNPHPKPINFLIKPSHPESQKIRTFSCSLSAKLGGFEMLNLWSWVCLILFCWVLGGEFWVEGLGVNWGSIATHKLPPKVVVQMLKDNGIQKVKLFDAEESVLKALAGSGIEVMVAISNDQLAGMTDYDRAKKWVQRNITHYNFDGGVNIK